MCWLACGAGLPRAQAASAPDYPARPLRILVPSTPGGSVDMLARTVGGHFTERWSQPVVIDNRGGAGGAIAGELLARAPADGYTLMMGTIAAIATNVSLVKKLPYDPLRDFAPITLVAEQPLMLMVHPSVPARSVDELIQLARARPGQLTFASAGNGTGGHLSAELLRMLTGINIVHVPYKGIAPALTDTISGQVTMSFSSLISGAPHVKSGRIRALAVTGARRAVAFPELPTMAEAGVKGYVASTWYGMVAPAGTARNIVMRLNSEIISLLKRPEVRERLLADGAEPVGNSPEEFAAFIKAEIERWAKVIRAAGIRSD
jgi:tripartite-type tricarboxylate transporter receptor subunit TctC